MNPWHLSFWLSLAALVLAATVGLLLAGAVAFGANWLALAQLVRTDARAVRQAAAARRGIR